MAELQLNPNQAALILELNDEGEMNVDVALPASDTENSSIAAAMIQVIAKRLVQDEKFQEEILDELK